MFLSVLPLTAQNTLANSCHSLQYTDGSEGVKLYKIVPFYQSELDTFM